MKTPAFTRALPRIILAATGIFALGASQSTAQLVAKPLACDESGGVVDLTMEIRDLSVLGTTPSGINGLVLQRSRDLIGWTTAHPAEVFIDPPTGLYPPLGGRWTASVSSPAGSGFFRFLGVVTTAEDTDGDGLVDGFESGVFPFTDPSFFDSDLDSFSDGQEFAYGTDPNSNSSQPVSAGLPTVGFAALHSTAVEGAGVHWLPIAFDRHFQGILNYAVDPLGNTTAGTDFTLGGVPTATSASLSVNGSTAAIPITILDNAQVSGQRAIIVHLRINGNSYFLGGGASHVVLLEDDDTWWTGTLIPASGEISSRSFRLAILRNVATSVVFGAGAGNDGLPVPEVVDGGGAPAIGNTSISTTLVPLGQWIAAAVVDSATRFHALSPPMPVRCGSLLGGQTILRQLELNAQPALQSDTQPHLLESNRMVGAYTETLTSSAGAPLAVCSGTFILIRDIPAPLPVVSALFPESP